MTDKPRYRYPGIGFFEVNDKDIFCGRTEKVEELFTLIMTNKTVVLHGESGTGKSSLIRAGLFPHFEEKKPNFLPVIIRFDDNIGSRSDDYLIIRTMEFINKNQHLKVNELPYICDKKNDFWYNAKLFEKNNYSLLLIFDQFEELQSYSREQVKIFCIKLFELFSSTIPPEIYDEVEKNTSQYFKDPALLDKVRDEYNKSTEFLKQPLSVKALFVIREDRLGTMSMLSDYFPDILKNDCMLLPLDVENARKAITEPALKEDGNFKTLKFEFQIDAVSKLLNELTDTNTGRVDPLQIQIVCSSIEKRIEKGEII